MMAYEYLFRIGGIQISLCHSCQLPEDKRYTPFMVESTKEKNTPGNAEPLSAVIEFEETEQLPVINGCDLVTEEDACFSEYLQEGRYVRTFHGTGTREAYAVLQKMAGNRWKCSYLKWSASRFQSIEGCFHHIALERILMEAGSLILHASFVGTTKGGLLFTGPSGIGKSTQAELWRQYAEAEVINGDRTILRKYGGSWYGYGSPYAGSSRIYKNCSMPIRAIAVLGQTAGENQCKRLSMREAFGRLYSQTTLNIWNGDYMNTAVELLGNLCEDLPVYYLNCRPEKSAVECLKRELDKLCQEDE